MTEFYKPKVCVCTSACVRVRAHVGVRTCACVRVSMCQYMEAFFDRVLQAKGVCERERERDERERERETRE